MPNIRTQTHLSSFSFIAVSISHLVSSCFSRRWTSPFILLEETCFRHALYLQWPEMPPLPNHGQFPAGTAPPEAQPCSRSRPALPCASRVRKLACALWWWWQAHLCNVCHYFVCIIKTGIRNTSPSRLFCRDFRPCVILTWDFQMSFEEEGLKERGDCWEQCVIKQQLGIKGNFKNS